MQHYYLVTYVKKDGEQPPTVEFKGVYSMIKFFQDNPNYTPVVISKVQINDLEEA